MHSKRPCQHAAEQDDKFAAPHSITVSGLAKTKDTSAQTLRKGRHHAPTIAIHSRSRTIRRQRSHRGKRDHLKTARRRACEGSEAVPRVSFRADHQACAARRCSDDLGSRSRFERQARRINSQRKGPPFGGASPWFARGPGRAADLSLFLQVLRSAGVRPIGAGK